MTDTPTPPPATTLFWRRPDAATLRGALTAVIIGWAIEIVYQVLYVIEDISWSLNDGPSALSGTFGDFFFNGIFRALFFFGPVFVALWLLLPVVKESTLITVLIRTAVAGIAGFVGLAIFGLVEAIADTAYYGFAFGYFSVTWLWFPLILALGFTVQTMVGAAVAWARPARVVAPPAAPATPTAPAAPSA
jgi:hypothetical protein